jgi:hypothetical protein
MEEEEQEEDDEDIPTQDPDAEHKSEPAQIHIRVVDAEGDELHLKMRPDTAMNKLFRAYSINKGVALGSVRFIFDGRRLHDDDTPAKVDIEDGDAIDVAMEQVGGWLQPINPFTYYLCTDLRAISQPLFTVKYDSRQPETLQVWSGQK